ncbi:MAG: 50S ribosomal protein L24 [Chloroflexota bacterium]|nr:50S ribosomal protein L24 [Chloroflexota bacterium]
MKQKIRKGDRVIVVSGKDKGSVGEVIRVIPDESRVIVQGVNLCIKHQSQMQSRGKTIPAGKIEFEAPIDISNVMLVDPKDGKPTRIRIEREDGQPVRIAKRSGTKID